MEILNTLLKITIYSGVIYLVILLLKKCLKMSPRLHYVLWLLLVARLVLPFDVASPVHFIVLHPDTQEQAAVQPEQDYTAAAPVYGMADRIDYRQTEIEASAPNVTAAVKSPAGLSAVDVLLTVWLAGMGVCLLYLAILSANLRLRIKKTAAPPSKKLAALFEEVRTELGIKRNVRLVCQYGYGAPALMFPRTVFMPIDTLLDMDDEQIKFALSHELTHFKRCDPWMNLALSVINAVYWFNPFVWLGFRQMRADMETACDSAVVRKLDTAQKNRYASFVVRLFAEPARPRYALGMAQGHVRKMAERRVQGIFMEGKSRKSAKTIAAAAALMLVIACFTTACAPVTAAEAKAAVIPESQTVQSAAVQTSAQAQTHWKEEIDMPETGVTIQADAEVQTPDLKAIPAVSVTPRYFVQQEVDRLIAYFTNNAQLYENDIPLTKSQYKDLIAESKAELAQKISNPALDMPSKEEIEAHISELKKMQKKAPESVERKRVDGKLRKSEGAQKERLEAAAYVGREKPALILVNNSSDELTASFCFDNGALYQPDPNLLGKQAHGQKLTIPEAAAAVEKLIADLGIFGMCVSSVQTGYALTNNNLQYDKQGYMVTFERYIGNIPVLNIAVSGHALVSEHINVSIDDTGVTSFRWFNPKNTGDLPQDSTKIISFEKAKEVFKQQIIRQYTVEYQPDAKNSANIAKATQQITIDKVRLGYMAIPQNFKNGAYMLSPVWAFLGHDYVVDNKGQLFDTVHNFYQTYAVLRINAADGSVLS